MARWPCGRYSNMTPRPGGLYWNMAPRPDGLRSPLVAVKQPNSAHGTGQHMPPGLATSSAVRRVGRVGGCNGLSRMYRELSGEDASPALTLPTTAPPQVVQYSQPLVDLDVAYRAA